MTLPFDLPPRPLKVAIASTGRFHVLDLARELRTRGHQIQFLAHISPARAERYGLAREAVTNLSATAAPWLAWQRVAPRLRPALRKHLFFQAMNRAVMRSLRPCDVFICMSGVYLEAAEQARARFGAQVFLERGSLHVDAQQALVGGGTRADLTARRERAGYALADRIVVPSLLARQSFAGDPALHAKTVVTPYGVDLRMFPSALVSASKPRQVLFVGTWSRRKGADILTRAIRRLGDVTLVHVGALGDVPFPQDPAFVHHDPVDQADLSGFYQAAPVFVLASREDGFGLVLTQALASGCACVASDHTGGPTIRAHWPDVAPRLQCVPAQDEAALAAALAKALDAGPVPPLPASVRESLGWSGYGARYEAMMQDALRPAPTRAFAG